MWTAILGMSNCRHDFGNINVTHEGSMEWLWLEKLAVMALAIEFST
jgi:hypothetical protein